MRITKISVKGLFGMFDHEIPLNQESRITIIHGPNGVGKTVLMRMVHGLFHYDYDLLNQIPYTEVCLEFDNGGRMAKTRELIRGLPYGFQYEDKTCAQYELFEPRMQKYDHLNEAVRANFPDFEEVLWRGKSYWIPTSESERAFEYGLDLSSHHHIDDLVNAFGVERLFERNPEFHRHVYGESPEWFLHMCNSTNVKFLQTQRLQVDMLLAGTLFREHDSYVIISNAEPDINNLAFRFMYLADGEYRFYDNLEDLEQYKVTEMKQERLRGSILDDAAAEAISAERRREEQSLAQTIRNKYEHREPYQSQYLFMDIINQSFLFKSFRVHTFEDGFKFILENGRDVPVTGLSSGEQHLLSLYYKLIFEIEPDTLVMIDEPELSMNVVWQRNFLKDLQRIIELRKFDVLIATHSPQIIHDKWDWMVPLGENIEDNGAD